jgi:uncharacterized protein with von Willebrand factor type A (vWA) domain
VSNLRQATPDIDWNRAHRMRGQRAARPSPTRLGRRAIGRATRPRGVLGQGNAAQGLPEVDVDAVRRNLGDDAARHVVRLQKALRALKDQGFIDRQGGQLTLSAKGVRQIGQQALKDLFAQLRDSPTLGRTRERRWRVGVTAKRPPSRGSRASRSRCTFPKRCATPCFARVPVRR